MSYKRGCQRSTLPLLTDTCGMLSPCSHIHQLASSCFVCPVNRVICMDCGVSSCRHELQDRLSALNPAFAERVAALSISGISSKGAWQRALRAGTAADARKVVQEAREASEQVGGTWICLWVRKLDLFMG